MIDKAIASGKPDLNLLFIYNITFRGMGKMMGFGIPLRKSILPQPSGCARAVCSSSSAMS